MCLTFLVAEISLLTLHKIFSISFLNNSFSSRYIPKCFWHVSDFPWKEFSSWPEGRFLWLERIAWWPGTLFLSFRFFVFSSSFVSFGSLGRYSEVAVEACPLRFFSSNLKPIELEIFLVIPGLVLRWARNFLSSLIFTIQTHFFVTSFMRNAIRITSISTWIFV